MSRILLTTALLINLLLTSSSTRRHDKRRRRHAAPSPSRQLARHPQNIPYRLFRPPSAALSSVLSPKLLRKSCYLVTLRLSWSSPSRSRDTSWMISLGDVRDLQDRHPPLYDDPPSNGGEGTIVTHSHLQYPFQPHEHHALCLPGEGLYTLTLLDWTGDPNGGNYTLLTNDDGRPLASGGMDSYVQSATFRVPLEPAESAAPSVSPAPSVSASPTRDCDWIEVEIGYDMYPEETSWMVIEGDYSSLDSGNITIIDRSPTIGAGSDDVTISSGAAGGSSMRRRVCLPGNGRYSFVIFDRYYNGICCEFGDGYYQITTPALPGEILGRGGQFTTLDIVTFDVPFVRAPTSAPSVSPHPTASHLPTVDCAFVELRLTFDGLPSQTYWSIVKKNAAAGGGTMLVVESPAYDDWEYGGVYTILSVCLPGEGVYTFAIEDKAGDGICCTYGEGSYELVYKGEDGGDVILVEGGEFEKEESTTFAVPFGTFFLAPTASPAPSIRCYEVEVSVTFDKYPYETIWLIVEGGLDGLAMTDDWESATVAESSKYGFNDWNTTDVRVECLPEGKYTFLIVDSDGICCDYGDGEYTVTLITDNGRRVVIQEGGVFTTLESVTFNLPFVPGSSPTMRPNSNGQAQAPTEGTSRFWVDIDLVFDAAPYEVSWVVTDAQSNVVEESPYYTMFYEDSSESHRVYLPNAGEYTFSITDTGGNGLCCSFGDGYYQVASHDPSSDVVIAQGSDFGSTDSVTFAVPHSGGIVSTFPTPFQGWNTDSTWPTPAPSLPPVRETPAPTEKDCTPVNIKLTFDVFPYDTHWWLVEGDLNDFKNKEPKFIGKSPSPSYDVERFANVTHSFCLGEGQYSFMIFDDAGNGMCCKAGDGSYSLTYGKNDEEFARGGRFGFFDIVVFEVPFPTRSPSWTPAPTTSMPTTFSPTSETAAPSPGVSVPNCDILLDLTTETDGDQSEIRWEVSLGDQSSTDNPVALIVAQSEQSMYQISKMGERTSDSDKVCLPGEGQYTFTIFDGNSGGDTRYRLVVDGAPVAYGSGFGYQESTTFRVPVTAQPSPAPQPGGVTPSPADCTMIDISITFDEFPDETYWAVYAGSAAEAALDDAIIVADSPFYLNVTENTTSHQVCLPGDGDYTFAIYDSANDGMCCSFGQGGYVVTSVDDPIVIVAEGGQFTDMEVTTFSVPIMIAPSTSPTVTPRPTVSSSPTITCWKVEITVTFDAFPSETVWTLSNAANETIAASPFYSNTDYANKTVTENLCLPDDFYTFLITDLSGDGNCCVGLGDGSYSIVYQGGASDVIIVDKGPDPTFVYYDKTEFIIPYVVPPTQSPTVSPAPTVSMAPSAKCIPIEVVINFDANPSDTLWEITFGDTNSWDDQTAVVAADSPLYSSVDMFSTVTHSLCLPSEEHYTFTVFDATGNGMCCDEGTGGFIILMIDDNGDREIIAEGAEFEWQLSVQFDLPITVDPRIDKLIR